MDPLTLALIIGGGSAFASKMSGAKTSDALKTGILSGGLSMLNPAAAASNPFASAFAEQSGKEGIKSLLIESAKQGLMQRGAKKLGIDPNIAMLGYGMFNTPGKIPGIGADQFNAANQVANAGNIAAEVPTGDFSDYLNSSQQVNVNAAFPGQSTSEIINNSNQYGSMPNFYDPSEFEGGAVGINQIPNNVASQIPVNVAPQISVTEQQGMPFPHRGIPQSNDYDSMIGNQAANYVPPAGGDGGGGTDYLKTITDVFKKDGKYDIDKIAKGATLFGVPAALYLSGAFNQQPKTMYQPTYNTNYPQLRQARGPLQRLDQQGNQVDVAMTAYPEQQYGSSGASPYAWSEKTFYPEKRREGGLISIQKFNAGGLSKAPNKVTHDENDVNNYMRINGYMEDSNGDKNEDTLLAQLADGEFVTRTDGVLGAGIIAGANPKNEKEMREKGAKFFYEQQKRFKRIFDLLDENRARKLH